MAEDSTAVLDIKYFWISISLWALFFILLLGRYIYLYASKEEVNPFQSILIAKGWTNTLYSLILAGLLITILAFSVLDYTNLNNTLIP